MRSSLWYVIAGAVVAGLVPVAAAAAPNDLDRSFGDRGAVVDPGFRFDDGDGASLGLRLRADGGVDIARAVRCAMGCRTFGLARFSPAGRPEAVPAVWHALPVVNDHDGPEDPDRLTGWRSTPDGGLELTYVGGDPATWTSPGTARGLPAAAPAGPFAYRLPPDGAEGTITPLPWRFEVTDVMPDGGRVGWAPDGWVGLLDAAWRPAAGFGPDGRLAPPSALGAPLGVAGGDAVRVGGSGDRFLRLWRIVRGAGGWTGAVTTVATPRLPAGTGVTGGIDVAPNGTAIVWRTWSPRHGTAATTDVAKFAPSGAPDREFGARGRLRVAGAWVPRIQASGKVVLAAPADGGARNIRVRRVNADASPDPSFPVTAVATRGTVRNQLWAARIDGRGRILLAMGLAGRTGGAPAGLLLARLRGGDAPALRLTAPARTRVNVARITATSSMAGRARITLRQAGRVVGSADLRFTRGARRVVTVRLRGASKAPLMVRATFRGKRATGAIAIPAAR